MAERTLRDLFFDDGAKPAPQADLGRIKRNVRKMVDQGAAEDEIDAYISGEGTTIDAVRAFKEKPVDLTTDIVKGVGYGANIGIDSMLNVIASPVRVPINEVARLAGYEGELVPQLELARRANVAPPESRVGKAAEAVGEVAGASVLPTGALASAGRLVGTGAKGILGQFARSPGKAAGLDALSATGAGGGVAWARDQELGPIGEIALGLAGGFAAPNAANLLARTFGGVRSGAQYANRQIQRAQDPETAAYRDVADAGVKAGFDFDEAARTVTPTRSANLARRGFTEDDLAQIVSRQLAGEHADDVARDFAHLVDPQGRPLTGATARAYLDRYLERNPTQMNVVDLAKDQLGAGQDIPLSNLARADMAISDDKVASGRLLARQKEQPGRVADIIEQSRIDGRNLDETLDHLKTVGRREENDAYGIVRQNAKPIDISGVIRRARVAAARRGGEIGRKLNEAIDQFFKPVLEEKPQSPQSKLRITEAEERLQNAIDKDASPAKIRWLERRLRTAKAQDDFSRPLTEKKIGEPLDDVGQFIDARQELSQMTKRSMQDGKGTPLTAELTQLRKELNEAARKSNPDLAAADAKFSGNRSVEELTKRGENLGVRLTPQTRRGLREFRAMTPTQQEIVRVSFEAKMAAEALGVRRGRAAADQYNSEAFDQIVATVYPKSAGKEIYERGQALLRNLKREAITTETARDALSGSRTAPLQDDIAALMEGPRAAADLATGRFGKLLENLSNRLTRQIGQKASQERIRILTETDPAQMLTMLRRLSREAKSSSERQAYAAAIREFALVGRRPAAEIGVTTQASDKEPR